MLAYIHARPSDISLVSDVLPLADSKSLAPAAQILLYRFMSAANAGDRAAFAEGLTAVHAACGRFTRGEIRARVASRDGLLGLFETEKDSEEVAAGASSRLFSTAHAFLAADFVPTIHAVVANLVAALFAPSNTRDVELLRPFTSILLADLAASSEAFSARVLGSADLVPFFSTDVTLPFADTLLAKLPSSTDSKVEVLLAAVFKRLDGTPTSPDFDQFWIRHFLLFVRASSSPNIELSQTADRILDRKSVV